METKTIDILPFDVLIEIFQLIPFEDLVSSVQNVNSQWQSYSRDPVLWKDISFKPSSGMRTEYVAELLKQAPLLRSFEFRDNLKTDEILNVLCEHNRNIVALFFESIDTSSYGLVRKVIKTYPNLENLQIPVAALVRNMALLGKLRKLKKVKCIHHYFSIASQVRPYEFIDSDWSALEDLCIFSENIDSKFQKIMEHVRGKLRSLEIQALWNASFLRHIPHCTNLENLKLNFMSCYMQNPDLKEVFGSMRTLANNLKCLTLMSFVHSDPDVLCWLFNKTKFLKLTELNLYNCFNFSRNVAVNIVSNCPLLQIIRLKGCVVLDDASVRELSKLRNLSLLDISGCPGITNEGLKFLPSCLHLNELNLSWNGFLSSPTLENISKISDIKILRLDNTEFNEVVLLNAARKLKHLRLLSVKRTQGINGEIFQKNLPRCFVRYNRKCALHRILRKSSRSLQSVDIRGVYKHTFEVLPEYRGLEKLSIDFVGRPCSQFTKFVDTIKGFEKLWSLSIKNFVQTERGQLFSLLVGDGLKQLKELKLENISNVNQDAVVLIASNFPLLEKLSLSGCKSLNDGSLSAIMNMESLKSLDISGCCELSEKYLEQIKKCADQIDLKV